MRGAAALFFSIALLVGAGRSASALPVFAHRYGMACQQCHTTVPHLNSFGEYFRNSGFSLPNARGVFPVAVKVNLAYGSDPDPTGLPKAVVDEVELLSGGTLGKSTNYFIEQYVVDGGRPGLTRDAWLQFRRDDTRAKIGQFELPLPIEVESERDTFAHYALYDQTVGINTFNFFDPRLGVDLSGGHEDGGFSAHLAAVAAYDRQTTTPRSGMDFMGSVAKTTGEVTLSTYRYQGQRNFAVQDRFWRQGFFAALEGERLSVQAVLQTGNDTSADGAGTAAQSSGGFLQAQYRFTPSWSAVARYEGTNDTMGGMQRQFVLSAITRPRRNMRFTLEGTQSRGHNALTAALLFAY
ncbi:MAG: hypothetical protein NVSMB31_16320 [Vulcanimicrobiaceae bacterium]